VSVWEEMGVQATRALESRSTKARVSSVDSLSFSLDLIYW